MKKFVCILLVLSMAQNALAAELYCRMLFSSTIESTGVSQTELVSYDFLKFQNPETKLTAVREKLFGPSDDEIFFDLNRYNDRKNYYRQILTGEVAKPFYKYSAPKSFEDGMALFEVQAELDPLTRGLNIVPKFLAKATKKDIQKLTRLSDFKDLNSPEKINQAIAKIYLLAHAPLGEMSLVLNQKLSAPAADQIATRMRTIMLVENFKTAIDQLQIPDPEVRFSTYKQFAHDHPNLESYARNLALAFVETELIGTIFFARPQALDLLTSYLEALPREQKIKIFNGDFTDVDPKIIRAFGNEQKFVYGLRILGIVCMIFLIYNIQHDLRHVFWTNLNKAERTALVEKVYERIVSDNENRGTYETDDQKQARKNNINKWSDMYLYDALEMPAVKPQPRRNQLRDLDPIE